MSIAMLGVLQPLATVLTVGCMVTRKLKVARIGNSGGVRLPASSLRRYSIVDSVLMEERSEGILLRPTGPAVEKLSWEETAREMAASNEDWNDGDATAADGLASVTWHEEGEHRVTERPARYRAKSCSRKRR